MNPSKSSELFLSNFPAFGGPGAESERPKVPQVNLLQSRCPAVSTVIVFKNKKKYEILNKTTYRSNHFSELHTVIFSTKRN